MLKRPWIINNPLGLVMEGKRLSLYNKKFQRPQVWAIAKNSHIMFEPYGHNLCYEPIPQSLGIV
jgi:hypothetical protein